MDLPTELEKLELLQVIDMRGSGVLRIPSSIEKLNNLRRLLASFANFGNENDTEIVSHNCDVISKISAPEELIIEVKSSERNCNKMLNVVTNKIGTMTKLTTLQFCFEDAVEDDMKLVAETLAFSVPQQTISQAFLTECATSAPNHLRFSSVVQSHHGHKSQSFTYTKGTSGIVVGKALTRLLVPCLLKQMHLNWSTTRKSSVHPSLFQAWTRSRVSTLKNAAKLQQWPMVAAKWTVQCYQTYSVYI